jgi:hypothetical protein
VKSLGILFATLAVTSQTWGAVIAFSSDITGGPHAGERILGTVTFSPEAVDALPGGSGALNPDLDSTVTVRFSFAGFDYTEADDTDFGSFPLLSFMDGEIQGLSYRAILKNPGLDIEAYIDIGGTSRIITHSFNGDDEYLSVLVWDVTVVPEPSVMMISMVAGSIFASAGETESNDRSTEQSSASRGKGGRAALLLGNARFGKNPAKQEIRTIRCRAGVRKDGSRHFHDGGHGDHRRQAPPRRMGHGAGHQQRESQPCPCAVRPAAHGATR